MSAQAEILIENLGDIVTAVETLDQGIAGDDVHDVIGASAFETIHDHFVELAGDSVHHRTSISLGAQRTGFYEKAADAVEKPQLVSEGVLIRVASEGLAQRYFGGTIEAGKTAKLLTIPARAESYGRRADEFDNLKLIMFGADKGALVMPAEAALSKRDRGIRSRVSAIHDRPEDVEERGYIYFWLVRSVTQEGDETVLPTDEEIADPALQSVQRYIERIWDERTAA